MQGVVSIFKVKSEERSMAARPGQAKTGKPAALAKNNQISGHRDGLRAFKPTQDKPRSGVELRLSADGEDAGFEPFNGPGKG
jgi:hypothetical protein